MFCISFSHEKADLNLRSGFQCTRKKLPLLFNALAEKSNAFCVYLSTCNRVELYGTGDCRKAFEALTEFFGVNRKEVVDTAEIYTDEKAVEHLFLLSAGLKSPVKGEDEILGQLKEAYAISLEHKKTDNEINTAFQSAFTSAKKIKTQTKLSKSSVSVASLAATKIKNSVTKQAEVLIIGATGDTGSKVMKNLISYGFENIVCTLREKHSVTMKDFPPQIKSVAYSDRYRFINSADVIVSATASPHYTVQSEDIISDKTKLFIDLASPRDIDPEVQQINENVLLCLDDFVSVAEENAQTRIQEIETAKSIIDKDIEEFLKIQFFNRHRDEFIELFGTEAYSIRDNSDYEQIKKALRKN